MKKAKKSLSIYQMPKAMALRAQPPTEYFDVAEAAQYLRCSPWTLRFYIGKGQLNCLRLGRKTLLKRTELERFLDAMTRKREFEQGRRGEKPIDI